MISRSQVGRTDCRTDDRHFYVLPKLRLQRTIKTVLNTLIHENQKGFLKVTDSYFYQTNTALYPIKSENSPTTADDR